MSLTGNTRQLQRFTSTDAATPKSSSRGGYCSSVLLDEKNKNVMAVMANTMGEEPGEAKRQRTITNRLESEGSVSDHCNSSATTSNKRMKKKHVSFATPLQEVIEVHSSYKGDSSDEQQLQQQQQNHEELFYTLQDFERFARNERFRRNALILAVTIGREQMKRLSLGGPLLSFTTVHQMYYKVLVVSGRQRQMATMMQQQRKSPPPPPPPQTQPEATSSNERKSTASTSTSSSSLAAFAAAGASTTTTTTSSRSSSPPVVLVPRPPNKFAARCA